ncbi:MAG TPA: NAD(P)-dependent oxidoreductase [Gaiellaceae bacterium]|nr:NAD(P)-dependent oxidoreductase [Gaiellaceae bacterium]
MSGRPRVHVVARVPAPVQAALEREFELVPEADDVEGLVAIPSVRVDEALLDRCGPRLRVVANYAVGLDNVDLEPARARGIVVANTPDVLTRATAELTLALLLALVRRVAEGDRLVRRGDPWRLEPTFMLGHGLDGRSLGVVGAGRIGTEVARLAEAFGMRPVLLRSTDPLEDALACDVVTLHCPLTPQTRHLVDASALARMRPHAVLVNTSRGPVVDEAALVEALREGRLAGAALDVYEDEPAVHPGLVELENVVLAPHLGSATHEAREAMGMLCVEALRAVLLEGRVPRNVVP